MNLFLYKFKVTKYSTKIIKETIFYHKNGIIYPEVSPFCCFNLNLIYWADLILYYEDRFWVSYTFFWVFEVIFKLRYLYGIVGFVQIIYQYTLKYLKCVCVNFSLKLVKNSMLFFSTCEHKEYFMNISSVKEAVTVKSREHVPV